MQEVEGHWTFRDGGSWDCRERTRVLGILNVTPDSFSDGGRYLSKGEALARALEMVAEGADAIDVGGESTRPGAEPVDAGEEAERVVPVIAALRKRLDAGGGSLSGTGSDERRGRETAPVRISVDTSKAFVAKAAIDAGADIVNDVTGLTGDPDMAPLLARTGAAAVVMHMRGTPRTMQNDPRYDDLMGEIAGFLHAALARARDAGVHDDRIAIDPGIGFGKTAAHNIEILARLPRLAPLGRPILVGVSRKSFLAGAAGMPVDRRLEAGLAASAAAVLGGASLLRTHDVGPTVRMTRMLDTIRKTGFEAG